MEHTRIKRGLTLVEGLLGASILAVSLAVAVPFIVRVREVGQARACVAHLVEIREAKAWWALEHHAARGMVPRDQDLFGPGRYLSRKPICATGGTYHANAVGENPTCTVGRNLDPYPHRW